LVANWVSGLNADIVGPMLTLKELMLTFGIVFEPLGADDEDDGDDDPQPAAIRPTAVAKPTQPTRPKRPLPLLPSRITHAPFARRHPNKADIARRIARVSRRYQGPKSFRQQRVLRFVSFVR
jgi:hypothetical protein